MKKGIFFGLENIINKTVSVLTGVSMVALSFGAILAAPLPAFADGTLSILTVNGVAPTGHCVAGPITITGSGTTGKQGGGWHVAIGWGDGATTTIDGAPGVTSGTLNGGNKSFTFSASHTPVGASTGLTAVLYHSQPSGQDGKVIVISQCVAAPTKGVVTVIKNVVNNNGGVALPSAFTLHINGNNFAGSTIGSDFQLNPGTYPVTEDAFSGYSQTGISCVGNSVTTTNGSVTVVAGKNYICTVTNDDDVPVNHAPIANAQSVSTNEDVALPIILTGSDFDSNPIIFTLSGGVAPANGLITLFNSLTGGLTYTPNANYNGTDSFTFKVNDGLLDSTYATVSITVNSVNDVPVANDDTYNTNEDTVLNVSASGVLTNDTDEDGNVLTAAVVSSATNGSLTLNADGSFDYTPNTNYSGVDSFTYKVNDGSANSNVATVYINVSSLNDAPVAVADSYTTSEDVALVVAAPGVLSNDSDADANPITAQVEKTTNDGALAFNADGSFTYTPGANWNGTDSFTYKVNDGTLLSSTQTVTITVTPVNDAPTANSLIVSTTINTNLTSALLASDIDNGVLTYATTSNPLHGTISAFNAATGAFTYTPNNGYLGSDTFSFTANDGSLDSNVATVSITVSPVAENTQSACSDGIDNDGDETIDLADSDCAAFIPATDVCPNIDGAQATVPSGKHLSEGQCVDDAVVTPPSGGGGGGGGGNGPIAGSLGSNGNGPIAGSLGNGGNGPFVGSVLGASTSILPELPAGCSALISSYMRLGKHNNSSEVIKLQKFLNAEQAADLEVSGFFGIKTDGAVRIFQKAHEPQVLTPWGITDPTGYVYKTTQRWINLTQCLTLDLPMPVLN